MQSRIAAITKGASKKIYTELLADLTYALPHQFIQNTYAAYQKHYPSNPSINGRIFEYLVCETLAREKIIPFYYQAQFKQVPNADFDVVLYHPQMPTVLTMKVSLRERYKQADLEGWALRQVYRSAKNYLITLEAKEAIGVQQKIMAEEVVGLHACVVASTPAYDDLLTELKSQQYETAHPILPITGTGFLS